MKAMEDELVKANTRAEEANTWSEEANARISSLQQDNSRMDWVTITFVHQLNQDKMKLKELEQIKLKAKVSWRDVHVHVHVHVHVWGGGLICTLHLYM